MNIKQTQPPIETPVKEIRRDCGGFELATARGGLRAGEVVVATIGPTPDRQRRGCGAG